MRSEDVKRLNTEWALFDEKGKKLEGSLPKFIGLYWLLAREVLTKFGDRPKKIVINNYLLFQTDDNLVAAVKITEEIKKFFGLL